MKKVIAIIAVLIVIAIVGIVYKEIRRDRLLTSDRDVLLINKAAGSYSYTSLMETAAITRSFKVIDYLDEISAEKLVKLTEDLNLIGTKNGPVANPQIQTPTNDEKDLWNKALELLTSEQKDLCKDMPRADFAQDCMFRHYMLQLFDGVAVDLCANIYVQSFVDECERVVGQQQKQALTDADGDKLIDMYEFYANPDSFQP